MFFITGMLFSCSSIDVHAIIMYFIDLGSKRKLHSQNGILPLHNASEIVNCLAVA